MTEFVFKYWVGIAFGLLTTAMGEMCRRYRCKFNTLQIKHYATELGVRALLRSDIIKMYNKYMDKGEIPIHELENIDDLFLQYENLGGNGVIKELVSRLKELPIVRG